MAFLLNFQAQSVSGKF